MTNWALLNSRGDIIYGTKSYKDGSMMKKRYKDLYGIDTMFVTTDSSWALDKSLINYINRRT